MRKLTFLLIVFILLNTSLVYAESQQVGSRLYIDDSILDLENTFGQGWEDYDLIIKNTYDDGVYALVDFVGEPEYIEVYVSNSYIEFKPIDDNGNVLDIVHVERNSTVAFTYDYYDGYVRSDKEIFGQYVDTIIYTKYAKYEIRLDDGTVIYTPITIPYFVDWYNEEEGGLITIEPGESLYIFNDKIDQAYFLIDSDTHLGKYRMTVTGPDGFYIEQEKSITSIGFESYIDKNDTYVIENIGNYTINFWFDDKELMDCMSYYENLVYDDEIEEVQWQTVNMVDGDLFIATNTDAVPRKVVIPYNPLNEKRFVVTVMNNGVKTQQTVDIYNDYIITLEKDDILYLYQVKGTYDIVQSENITGIVYREVLNNNNVPDGLLSSDLIQLYQLEQQKADEEEDLTEIEEQIKEIKGIRGILTKVYSDVVYVFETLVSFVGMLSSKSGQVMAVFKDIFSVLPDEWVQLGTVGISIMIIVSIFRK
ncbi:hypothetical protein [Caloranaerobacter ferrireducens]|uniref:hypothetical protein n=1 Tax=Caloranaerobacter ferrireducens TaxID=1323370 RepID=UPI00084D64E9|nr:hypothetical protein [Caloranaerobacter ferrireducens]